MIQQFLPVKWSIYIVHDNFLNPSGKLVLKPIGGRRSTAWPIFKMHIIAQIFVSLMNLFNTESWDVGTLRPTCIQQQN